jgi:fatty acid desaturase
MGRWGDKESETGDGEVKMTGSAGGMPIVTNISLAIGYGLIHLYQFFILPLWLLPLDQRWAWSLLPLALLNNPFWSLLHETIHDLFHPKRRINLIFGRLLSILFGSPFLILRLSHLLHHKLNRTPKEATELYERGKVSLSAAAFGYYFQILGGLYLTEFLSSLLFLLPGGLLRRIKDRFVKPDSVSGILLQNWTQDEAVREIRIDGLCIFTWFGLSLFCYGASWPLLLAALAARGFLISFLDNVYHYRTPLNDIFYASNLWLAKPIATVLLNFNFHGIHHKNPAIPWTHLPSVFRDQRQIFHGDYFIAAARQLRGPVALQDLPGRAR